MSELIDTIQHMDLFELCRAQGDASIDMILCDLPYGVTACEWDNVIPMEEMWTEFKRVIKPRGAIVLTATEPFASKLRMSNLGMYKYDWVWDKKVLSNVATVKLQPARIHEQILIFYFNQPTYNPLYRDDITTMFGKKNGGRLSLVSGNMGADYKIHVGYPLSIISIMRPNNLTGGGYHPTQKPVALFEYLIKTYTQEGAIIFDPCAGSGTTAVAAMKTNRHYICGDITAEYVQIARERVAATNPFVATKLDESHTQLSLFESVSNE